MVKNETLAPKRYPVHNTRLLSLVLCTGVTCGGYAGVWDVHAFRCS